jgi:6-phosphogluconate dehydrogenase
MNIAQASTTGQITNFMGGFATLDREACAVSGTLLDRVLANYEEGPAAKTIAVDAYVVMRAQCAKQQIWVEAFGLPGGKVAMSGRATFIDAEGKRAYAPIAFGR